jgi:hypothetical protein
MQTAKRQPAEAPREFDLNAESRADVDRLLDACDTVEELARLPFRAVSIETPPSVLPNDSLVIVKPVGQEPMACRWHRKGGIAHIHGLDGKFRFRLLLKEVEWTRRVVESGFNEKDLKKGKATAKKKKARSS